ncbi:MAG TPA: hypothetical protein VLG28_12935 [Acidimicrobiia bacterium]|jgi:hypothetical protein|nr:hypothetical protein [Acidimicrobiia bacterium]
MADETLRRWAPVSGGIFAVAFFVGLLLVGDQAGAFADSEQAYSEIFSDDSHRTLDLAGSLLLVVSAVAFGTFALQLSALGEATQPSSVVMRVGGALAAVSMLMAGAAFLTVPASLLLGDFYGDPGLVTAQPVLPHFGYILLVVGSAIPAAALMVASARLAEFPTWLKWGTVVAAVLLVVTGPSVITMLLLPMWVATVALVTRRAAPITPSVR